MQREAVQQKAGDFGARAEDEIKKDQSCASRFDLQVGRGLIEQHPQPRHQIAALERGEGAGGTTGIENLDPFQSSRELGGVGQQQLINDVRFTVGSGGRRALRGDGRRQHRRELVHARPAPKPADRNTPAPRANMAAARARRPICFIMCSYPFFARILRRRLGSEMLNCHQTSGEGSRVGDTASY